MINVRAYKTWTGDPCLVSGLVHNFDPSLGRQRQAEPSEFEVSLVYIVLLVTVFIEMTETEHTSLRSITS